MKKKLSIFISSLLPISLLPIATISCSDDTSSVRSELKAAFDSFDVEFTNSQLINLSNITKENFFDFLSEYCKFKGVNEERFTYMPGLVLYKNVQKNELQFFVTISMIGQKIDPVSKLITLKF